MDYVDTEPEARAYLEKFDISYPNGPDLGTKVSQLFRIKGVPETYFIDQTGVLRYVQVGHRTSFGRGLIPGRASHEHPFGACAAGVSGSFFPDGRT